jgi:hypothetical protein
MSELGEIVGRARFRTEQPLELLTLSACRTAKGDERAALGLAGVAIQSGARDSFPSLETKRDRADLGVTYQLRRNMALRGGWLYERYRSDDWGLDGVQPDTMTSVLTWGANSPDYNISVFTLSFTYDLGKPASDNN